MLKVFHFAHKPPFPLRDGGCVAISSILKSLLSSDETEVYHFTLFTHKHPYDPNAYPEKWKKRMRMEEAFVNTKTDLAGAIIHLFKDKSYNLSRFYDKKVARRITEIFQKERFDIILLESIYVMPYLHLFIDSGAKIVLRAHNVEHSIWEQMGQKASFPLKKWYFGKLAAQLEKFEKNRLRDLHGIIAISEEDAMFFQRFEPQVMTTVIPTAVKTNFPTPDYSLNDFYFLGAMDWKPNKEGIDWLLRDVIPTGLKGTSLTIAGKALKKNEIKHPDVICEGEVKNALEFIESHGICLIPMLSGSGIKIKLLENLALGKPVVSTSEGVKGVEVTHGKEVLIADDPKEFREAMYALHLSEEKRKSLGEAGKEFVMNNFGEQKITRRVIAFLKDI
ncbi:MAG: glycosyltransferase family 4 protein [Brumimicrobium sp.]|nr:glycosyltransferase family 4 protein [Brumimicrobium sp.]